MLYKRGKVWYTRFTANGVRVNKSCQTSSRAQAERYEARLKNELWEQQHLDRSTVTWDEAVSGWLAVKQGKRSLDDDLRKLVWLGHGSRLGGLHLSEISAGAVDNILETRGVSNATRNRYAALIRSILNRAHKLGQLAKVPHIERLPEPKSTPRYLTHGEAAKLLKALDTPRRRHLRDMVAFSLATGLREANVTRLKWSQIDLERSQMVVEATKSKSGATLRVPLNNAAMDVLRSRIENDCSDNEHICQPIIRGDMQPHIKGRETYVFTYRGKPVRKANRDGFQKACEEAGLSIRWHDLRHTWASWHVQAGTPLKVLQELGGWSDMSMVMRYAHLSPDHVDSYAGNVQVPLR